MSGNNSFDGLLVITQIGSNSVHKVEQNNLPIGISTASALGTSSSVHGSSVVIDPLDHDFSRNRLDERNVHPERATFFFGHFLVGMSDLTTPCRIHLDFDQMIDSTLL